MNLCKKKSTKYEFEMKDRETVREENINKIQTYKIRWFILIVICLVNISNSINW